MSDKIYVSLLVHTTFVLSQTNTGYFSSLWSAWIKLRRNSFITNSFDVEILKFDFLIKYVPQLVHTTFELSQTNTEYFSSLWLAYVLFDFKQQNSILSYREIHFLFIFLNFAHIL